MKLHPLVCLGLLILGWTLSAPVSAQLYSRFGSVPWIDVDGASRTLEDYKGRPVVMTMSYTSCRKTCSTSMLVLKKMQQILQRRGRDAAFVVVSYDPVHDTPQEWQRYRDARRLPSTWHFLSGAPSDTRRLAEFLELNYWVYDEHVMHDFRIVLFDAEGRRKRDILWEPSMDLEHALADL
jgi:protein SCO1